MASTSADEELLAAGRLVRLGLRWSEALERSAVAGLARLGGVMRRAETLGAPLADQLEHLLEQDEEAASRMYEEAVRRAPVRMVLPLTLCVLPAFVLLSVGPFLGQVGAAS
jgi:tight adherence protein C